MAEVTVYTAKDLWVDANVLIRLITGEPLEMASRALALARRSQSGEVTLHLSALVAAEVVWVLRSFYHFTRSQITDALMLVVTAEGVVIEEQQAVVAALRAMADKNVDFADAFLAEKARTLGHAVCSFDQDFRRLNVDVVEPA